MSSLKERVKNALYWRGDRNKEPTVQSYTREAYYELIDLIKDQQDRIEELEEDLRFIWRCIERGKFDTKHCTAKGAIDVLANYPSAPWNKNRASWDTSHKDYNAEIDKFVSKQALTVKDDVK